MYKNERGKVFKMASHRGRWQREHKKGTNRRFSKMAAHTGRWQRGHRKRARGKFSKMAAQSVDSQTNLICRITLYGRKNKINRERESRGG
jgi:hypothetical protein